MKEMFLGEYIKQERLKQKITQEQLCEGICDPITVSRMENGKQMPSYNRIRAFLQRLGLPDKRFRRSRLYKMRFAPTAYGLSGPRRKTARIYGRRGWRSWSGWNSLRSRTTGSSASILWLSGPLWASRTAPTVRRSG